eukprot:4368-Heterococcus_DN1.PRE.1
MQQHRTHSTTTIHSLATCAYSLQCTAHCWYWYAGTTIEPILTLNSSVGLSSIKGGVPYRKHHSVTPAAHKSAAYALKCLPLLHISGAQNDHVPSVRVSCARETDLVSKAVSTGVLQHSAQQEVVLLHIAHIKRHKSLLQQIRKDAKQCDRTQC